MDHRSSSSSVSETASANMSHVSKHDTPRRSILRIWGHADNLAKAEEDWNKVNSWAFNIVLERHESIVLPLKYFRHKQPALYIPPPSRALVSRYTQIRLDRHSDYWSSLPFLHSVQNAPEGSNYDLVLVYLFDRSRVRGSLETFNYSRYPKLAVPEPEIAEAVRQYLDNHSLTETLRVPLQCSKTILNTKLEGASNSENKLIKGRLRRRCRRHGSKRPIASSTVLDTCVRGDQDSSHSIDISINRAPPRGRIKRRHKRDKHYSRRSNHHVEHGRALQVSTLPQEITPPQYIQTNIITRLPPTWRNIPRIMLQGDVRDDFSDSVVVPLPSLLNRQQILGLLVLSRSSLFSGWSRSRNLIECAETTQRIFLPFHFSISPGKLVRHGFPDTPKGIQGYWCKFPLSIASHLRPEAKYGVEFFSSFTLSQWCSFSHPQLIYPDHDERSITDDRGYSETFFCCRESSRSEISQELNSTRWVRPLDSHWRREHRGFAKQNDRGQGSNPGEPQSNLGKGGQEKLRDYELEYKLEEEPEEETEKNEVEDQELIEDEAYKERQYIHELDAVETREIWYANWGQSHIPLWHQEQTLHQIAALATSTKPGLASPVAAHAAFEYGLCMLKGFGTSQDIERGLEWVQYGAHIGSPHARAVAHGLHRAYDRGPDLDSDPLWLVKEATCLSDYTQRELEHLLKSTGGHSQQRSMEGVCDSDYESSRSWKEAMNSRNHERAFKAHCRLEIFPRLSLHHPTMLQRQLQLQDPESNGLLAPLLAETAPAEHTPMFFRAILRWLCCTSQLVTGLAEVLVTAAIPFLQQEDLDELFMLALQRGSASWSSFLLDVGARRYTRSDKEFLHPDSRPLAITPLFLLHHISNEEVGHLVLKIVSKGFNVNDRVPVALVDRHPYYPSGSRAYMKKSFSERERFHTTHLKDQIRGSSITPLRWAIAKNRPGLVRALIDAGAEFPLIPDKQAYALENRDPWATDIPLVAVLDQPCYNVEMLRMFLEKHCDQRGEVVFSESPLGLIAMEPDSPMRRLRIVQHLGGGPDRLFPTLDLLRGRQSQSDAELFWAAAMNGHEDIARYLISKGVNIELRWMGMTPLHTSILHGRWGVFQLLLQNGADPWATTTQKGMSALHLLFWKAKPVETELFILGELYAILGDVSAAYSNFGETVSPLHLAVMNSRVRAVRRLIELGADTTAVLGREIMTTMVGEEYTALGIERQVQLAGWERSLGGPQEVQRYVPLRPIEIKGFTAAGLILLREDMFLPEQATRMLKILLAAPTSTDLDEKQFCTRPDIKQNVLHLLAWSRLREKSDVLDWVLEVGKNKGLDLNVRDIHGDTPLHYAYAVLGPRFNTAVNELIKRGADLALRNDIGLTPPEMRNGILLQGFPSPTHPIEITLSRCDQQQKANEPTGLSISRSSELLWSLEKGIFTRTEFWDSKSRKSVKLQKLFKLQEWDSDDETDTKDDGPGFQVQLKTPGSTPATDPKRYETPTDGVIILEIPADLEY